MHNGKYKYRKLHQPPFTSSLLNKSHTTTTTTTTKNTSLTLHKKCWRIFCKKKGQVDGLWQKNANTESKRNKQFTE